MADRSYNFDGGTLPPVFNKTRTDIELVTDRVLSGSHSVHMSGSEDAPFFQWIEPEMQEPGGAVLESIQIHLQESSSSGGTAFKLYNEDGDPFVGMATTNPDWEVWQGDGSTGTELLDDPGSYDQWLRFRMALDWGNQQATFEFENLATGDTDSITRPFLVPANGVTMAAVDDSDFAATTSDTWLDEVQLTFAPFFDISGTVTEDGNAVSAPVYLFDADFNKLGVKNSANDGTYKFRRPFKGMQYYILTAVSGRRPLVHGPFSEPEPT